MKKLTAILLLSFTLLTLSCCKKDDEPLQQHTLLLPQEVKDYLLFKPGSNWVYKHSTYPDYYDSIYVHELSFETLNIVESNYELDFEQFYLTIYSYDTINSFNNIYHIRYRLYVPDYYELDNYKTSVKRESLRGTDLIGPPPICFFNDSNVGSQQKIKGSNGHIELIRVEKEFLLHDSIYKDVLVFKNNDDLSWGSAREINYYFAKNVGLIKRENLKTATSWELISYNVKQ